MNLLFKFSIAIVFTLSLSACDFSCAPKAKQKAPKYDENYAFEMILKYEKFGPKVPGSDAHIRAGDWLRDEMKSLGLTVHEQKTTATTFDKHTIPVRNLIGQFNPSAKTRYLLSAHWDNRPFSDEAEDPKLRKLPVPGVNDGGSGVVILLGVAKALSEMKAAKLDVDFGVDFLFLDAEDWGTPSIEESYCLGTQYWAKHTIPENYKPRFGLNYDMVGRIGSVFPVERLSYEKGAWVYEKLHQAAAELGYQDFFPKYRIGPIVDDHVYLMEGHDFPVLDLIYMTEEGRFAPEWHTPNDTSDFISRDVLKVVGQTTLQTLFND